MTLTELLPTIRQLSAIEKQELIRILIAEEDIISIHLSLTASRLSTLAL